MNLFHVLKGVGGQVMERAASQWRIQLPASYEKRKWSLVGLTSQEHEIMKIEICASFHTAKYKVVLILEHPCAGQAFIMFGASALFTLGAR